MASALKPSMRRFEGKVAVVTGAGRAGGIGEAIGRRIVQEGGAVVVVDLCRDQPEVPRERFGSWAELEAVAKALAAEGGRAEPIKTDVTSEAEVSSLFQAVGERFGRLDALFNNAGGGTGAGPVDRTPLVDLDETAWRYTFEVSLNSVFLCSKHASSLIARGGGGAIVNTVSISAHHGVAGTSAYSAAKAGVIALTRTLALELAPRNIRVNAFSPGLTLTPYVRQRFDHMAAQRPELSAEEHMSRLAEARIPLGRPADPSEMAAVAAFLASEDAGYMTGQILQVDGGLRV